MDCQSAQTRAKHFGETEEGRNDVVKFHKVRAGYACKYTSENWDLRQRSIVQARGQVKSGITSLHVMTLWKATTVHLAHGCMKHEAASKCRRWRANRRRLRRLRSSCMQPRRKAEPRQESSTRVRHRRRSIAATKISPNKNGRPEIGARGGEERQRQQLCGNTSKKVTRGMGNYTSFTQKRPQPFQPNCPCLIQTPCPRRRPSEESFATATSKWRRRSCSKKGAGKCPCPFVVLISRGGHHFLQHARVPLVSTGGKDGSTC